MMISINENNLLPVMYWEKITCVGEDTNTGMSRNILFSTKNGSVFVK